MINPFHPKALQQVELSDVEHLLDDAKAEPLHWEAKGIKIEPGEIRKQVCGFANSHDGGYLILGTRIENDAWVMDGVEFPNNDPPAWISEVAEGVQPTPGGLDTRSIQIQGPRWITITWVPPTPTPPCNAHGTVYERVSGRTVSVREPLRLAQLFGRGDQAHDQARVGAADARDTALMMGDWEWEFGAGVTISFGIMAVGYAGPLDAKLFTIEMRDLLTNIVPGDMHHFVVKHRQDAVVAWTTAAPPTLLEGQWFVRAAGDGSIGVACRFNGLQEAGLKRLVEESIRNAWEIATVTLKQLAPVGPTYLHLGVEGGQFNLDSDAGPDVVLALRTERCRIDRGPIDQGVDDALLPGIEREILRYIGTLAFEVQSQPPL